MIKFKEVTKGDIDPEIKGKVEEVKEKLYDLERVRKAVDDLSIDRKGVVEFYTGVINDLISLVGSMAHHTTDIHLSARITALEEFSRAKDLEGIKRALLSVVFAKDSMDDDMRVKIAELRGKESAFLTAFMDVAPEVYKERYEKNTSSPDYLSAKELENLALSRSEGYGVDAEEWFSVQTKRIDLFKSMEDFMVGDIQELSGNIAKESFVKFLGTAGAGVFILCVTAFFVSRTLRVVNSRIEESVNRVKKIADTMEFSCAKLESTAKDEFAVLEKAVSNMISSLGCVVRDLNKVMNSLAKGHFRQEIKGTYKGDIKTLMDDVNTSLRELSRAMDSIKDVMEKLAKGVLTTRIEDSYGGDLADLTHYINESIENLRVLVKQIKDDLMDMTSNIASINTSVDETSEAIRQISEETLRARNMSSDMSDVVEKGKERVEEMHTKMREIVSVSDSINQITGTIINIAEQTNLLALNAAIEAARAGELGRSFAVVADEVRRLAEVSGNAAKEISELIDNVVATVREGGKVSEHVVESYENIEKVVKEVIVAIDTIATAMEEQSRAVDIIRDNITNITQSTERIEENIKKFEV